MNVGSLKRGDLVHLRDWDPEKSDWFIRNDLVYMIVDTHNLPGYDTNHSIDFATIVGDGVRTVVVFQHLVRIEQ
jgi:hypothetical protein